MPQNQDPLLNSFLYQVFYLTILVFYHYFQAWYNILDLQQHIWALIDSEYQLFHYKYSFQLLDFYIF